jgi:hypothetical protein
MALLTPRRIPRAARLALATAVTCLVTTGVAQAAGCPNAPVAQPFTQFGDTSYYTLVPDGGFEGGGAGWTPSGSIVSENESFFVGSTSDAFSLQATSKVSAVSPAFCVDQDMPSLRLFARKLNPAKSGHLKVEVLYSDSSGNQKVATAGTLSNGGKADFASWQPSGLLKLSTVIPTTKKGTASVQVRLTADTGGDWLVDDVYADPRLRR